MKQNNWFDRANETIRDAESSVLNFLSAIAPWGAPIIPASMAYGGMTNRLNFYPVIALIGAIVIEILGLATVSTAVTFWQHNRRQKADYKRMPVIVPAGMYLCYLVIVITTNVLLELPTDNYIPLIARALLTLLSIPAGVTVAIRTQHTELLKEIASGKIEKVAGKLPEIAVIKRQDWRNLPNEDRQLVAGMKAVDIMRKYGIPERTASNWRKAARNGNEKMIS